MTYAAPRGHLATSLAWLTTRTVVNGSEHTALSRFSAPVWPPGTQPSETRLTVRTVGEGPVRWLSVLARTGRLVSLAWTQLVWLCLSAGLGCGDGPKCPTHAG